MLNDSEATRLWQRLFRGQTITSLTLAEAELVIDKLPLESPVRLRLSKELDEIRSLHHKQP